MRRRMRQRDIDLRKVSFIRDDVQISAAVEPGHSFLLNVDTGSFGAFLVVVLGAVEVGVVAAGVAGAA